MDTAFQLRNREIAVSWGFDDFRKVPRNAHSMAQVFSLAVHSKYSGQKVLFHVVNPLSSSSLFLQVVAAPSAEIGSYRSASSSFPCLLLRSFSVVMALYTSLQTTQSAMSDHDGYTNATPPSLHLENGPCQHSGGHVHTGWLRALRALLMHIKATSPPLSSQTLPVREGHSFDHTGNAAFGNKIVAL